MYTHLLLFHPYLHRPRGGVGHVNHLVLRARVVQPAVVPVLIQPLQRRLDRLAGGGLAGLGGWFFVGGVGVNLTVWNACDSLHEYMPIHIHIQFIAFYHRYRFTRADIGINLLIEIPVGMVHQEAGAHGVVLHPGLRLDDEVVEVQLHHPALCAWGGG